MVIRNVRIYIWREGVAYTHFHWKIQGGAKDTPPLSMLFFSILCNFGGKFDQILSWHPKLCGYHLHPLPRLPRLGNPGSVTVLLHQMTEAT